MPQHQNLCTESECDEYLIGCSEAEKRIVQIFAQTLNLGWAVMENQWAKLPRPRLVRGVEYFPIQSSKELAEKGSILHRSKHSIKNRVDDDAGNLEMLSFTSR